MKNGGRVSNAQKQVVLETCQSLNCHLDLHSLLNVVLDKAIEVIQAEAGTLWMVEEEEYLIPMAVRGPGSAELKHMRLKPGEGLAGQVVLENEAHLIKDVRKDPAWASRFDDATGFSTISLMSVPLRGPQEVIGCLQVVNKRGRRYFSTTDLQVAMIFAGQAAVALENSRLYTWQGMLLSSIIQVLACALDARDPYTRGHSERVSKYAILIGNAIGFSKNEMESLERAALLHDIGKIGLPDEVLLCSGPLDDDKWRLVKTHPDVGARILADVRPRHLAKTIYEGALYHQEKFDGTGYGQGLKGDEIPLVGRIIAIADAFDAITSDRAYRPGTRFTEALSEIQRCAGTQFDPKLVNVFIKAIESEYVVEYVVE